MSSLNDYFKNGGSYADDIEELRTEMAQLSAVFTGQYVFMPPKAGSANVALVEPKGVLLERSGYPRLWAWAQSQTGLVVDDAQWMTIRAASPINACALYSSGDGSTTFRIPDMGIGGFSRFLGNGPIPGDIDTGFRDQIENHTHSRGTQDIKGTFAFTWNVSNGFHALSTSGAFYRSGQRKGRLQGTDGTNGTCALPYFQASRAWTGESSEPLNADYGDETHPQGDYKRLYIYTGNGTSFLPAPTPDWLNQQAANIQSIANLNTENTALKARLDAIENGALGQRFGVKDAKMGYQYTLFLGMDNKLYVAGNWNDHNMPTVGADIDSVGFSPVILDYSSGLKAWDTASHGGYALMNDGKLYYWGRGDDYQNGLGSTSDVSRPLLIADDVDEIVFSSNRSYNHNYSMQYIKKTDGKWYGWGRNSSGRLGTGSTSSTATPTLLGDLPSGTISKLWSVGTGYGSTYALSTDGKLYGCGYNGYGCLGIGSTASPSVWAEISVISGQPIKDIQGGRGYYSTSSNAASATIFLLENGDVYSTGDGGYGQTGLGSTTDVNVPTKVNVSNVEAIHCCGGGPMSVYCEYAGKTQLTVWGYNSMGQLGVGNQSNQSTPVTNAYDYEELSVRGQNGGYQGNTYSYTTHAVMRMKDGRILACGENRNYQCMPYNGVAGELHSWTQTMFYDTENIAKIISGSPGTGDGTGFTYIIKTDGRCYGVGYNGYHQLRGFMNVTGTSPVRYPRLLC